LSERDKEILGAQNIDLGNGKSASALDIVNSMDKILDNWDQSFDEMVDQGIAEPQDKDKLKSSMTKYRNMMADTKLSAAEKQKLREQMIKDGLLTQAQMDYLDQQAEQQKGREYNQDLHKENQVGKQQISVEARASALAEPEVTSAKNPATQGFSTVAPSGIDTEVKLTETYNIKSLAAAANDQKEISTPTVTITPKAPVQSVSGDMGFG
jgi:hypothetical protein